MFCLFVCLFVFIVFVCFFFFLFLFVFFFFSFVLKTRVLISIHSFPIYIFSLFIPTDFGASRLVKCREARLEVTACAIEQHANWQTLTYAFGTPLWCAPEIMGGKKVCVKGEGKGEKEEKEKKKKEKKKEEERRRKKKEEQEQE